MTRVGTGHSGVSIERLAVSAYEIPTDGPDGREADGTLTWDSTTMILVEAHAAGQVGIGLTYGDVSVAHFVESKLRSRVEGDRPGVGAMALSAVDLALWDLAARLLGVSLHRLVGGFHDHVPLHDFADLVTAGAVDCMQADVTRCGGITSLIQVAGLCAAHQIALSGHCAPAMSAHAFCGVQRLRHLEYFHDHVRIEHMVFDGVLSPQGGSLPPDPTRPGNGLTFKRQDAERYRIWPGPS